MKQYDVLEIDLIGCDPGNDWVHVNVLAEFVLNGKHYTRKGFYAGKGRYKVRFMPEEPGILHYNVSGIVQAAGEKQVEPASDGRHGMVKAEGTVFRYQDGTKYLPFGTTVYALLHQEHQVVEQTMETMKGSPFNKIRFCVFPKHYAFNDNEPKLFAFEKNEEGSWDVNRPCIEFWEELELRISQFDEMGVQVDLILFHPYDHWGFMHLNQEECLTYLEYVMRRISAYPNVWWSLANEYEQMTDFTKERWEEMAAFLGRNDGGGHLLSNHNFVHPWDFSNTDTTHVCLQDADAPKIPALSRKFGKPVIYDELGYEGNIPYSWGNLSAFEMVNRFWKIVCYGGYATHGETYMDDMNDDQCLWWSKGGILKGQSMERIGFLRKLTESFPGTPVLFKPEDSLQIENRAQLKQMLEQNIPGVSDNPVYICMSNMTDEEFTHMLEFFTDPVIHVGKEVYLKYFGDMCTIYGKMQLPEEHLYTVEIIDVWEMTRTVAAEHVNGIFEVKLPGKPGIAILAARETGE